MGHNVRILERSTISTRANHAAGMGTGLKGHEFMATYNPDPQPHAYFCPGYQSLDLHSKVTRTLSAPLWVTSWDVVYYRLRVLFDGLSSPFYLDPPPALEGDGEAHFELAKHVTDVIIEEDLVVVTFQYLSQSELGGTRRAHLVLDASGAYSIIRQKFLPDITYPYAGFVVWRGTVPESAVPERTRKLFETRFNVFSIKDGYIAGYVTNHLGPCLA